MAVETLRLVNRFVGAQVATQAAPDFGTLTQGRVELDKYLDVLLTPGTGAGQADRVFLDSFNIAASGTLDYDLNGGALTDVFGVAVSFVEIVGLGIWCGPNTNNVVLSTAATNPWLGLLAATDLLPVRPNASFTYICGPADTGGLAVVAGTGDTLRLANSGAGSAVTGDLVIVGRSA